MSVGVTGRNRPGRPGAGRREIRRVLTRAGWKRFHWRVPNFSRRPQLITYPDSLGGTIATLNELMTAELHGLFAGGVHVLPPFPSTSDRGFSPTRYDQVDDRFGSFSDLKTLARLGPLTLDIMANHISRMSSEFQSFEQHGRSSPYADMFMRPDKIWPSGNIPDDDVKAIFLRKPTHPFLDVTIKDTGDTETVWATFGSPGRRVDQIDLDWTSPLTVQKYDSWFESIASAGGTEVRLDAVGYLTKQAGTSCFMIQPAIWQALESFTEIATRHGLSVLPEVHADRAQIEALTEHGFPTYDFVLPGLTAHALRTTIADPLVKHLTSLPTSTVTTLDTHDGIPIQPDLVGVIPHHEIVELVNELVGRGANVNRILGAEERGVDFDAHQINISYIDAAGGDDALVVARAIQMFCPGRPQVYYQGLLGGPNDYRAVEMTGEGRAINRTNYSLASARDALQSDVAGRQCELLRLRSSHPAFEADQPSITQVSPTALAMRWEHGDSWCRLEADLAGPHAQIHMGVSGAPASKTWSV